MRFRAIVLFYAGLCLVAAAKEWKFDFGTPDSPVMQDCVRISEQSLYSEAAGFGWLDGQGLRSGDEKKYDDLGRDYVQVSGAQKTFQLELPNGEYHLVIYHSYNRGWNDFHNYLRAEIVVNGEKLLSAERWTLKNVEAFYLRNFYDDLGRSDTAWSTGVQPLTFRERTTTVVQNGLLAIQLRNTRINALLISTAPDPDRPVEAARQKQFEATYKYEIPANADPGFEPTETQKKAGFLLYARHWIEPAFPELRPEDDEIDAELEVVIPLGGQEPTSLLLLPLADLQNVRVEVKNLPLAAKIMLEHYRFEPMRQQSSVRRQGAQLLPFTAFAADQGMCRKIWFDFVAPADAAAGIYQGEIQVTADNFPAQTVKIKLRILPFPLDFDREHHNFAFQYIGPRQYISFPNAQEKRTYIESELRFMREFGFTVPTFGYGPGSPRFTWDKDNEKVTKVQLDELLWLFDLSEKIDFPGKYVLYTPYHLTYHGGYQIPVKKAASGFIQLEQADFYWKAVIEVLRPALQAAKNAIPEKYFLLITGGELSNGGLDLIKFGCELHRRLRDAIPEIKIANVANGDTEFTAITPLDDVAGMSTHIAIPDNIAFGQTRSRDKTLLLYQAFNRFTYGFYFHKIEAKLTFKEDFDFVAGNPYNSFDGDFGEMAFSTEFCLPGPEGPVPIRKSFEYRSGITDARYLYTLECWIARARQAGRNAAAEQAEQALQAILAQVNPDLLYYRNNVGFWSPRTYDKLRWRIAKTIIELQEAMQ